jgi:hypothetical protein
MLRNNLIAAIRTGVAAFVVFILGWVATKTGIKVDDQTVLAVTGLFFALAVAGYNFLVNFLTHHVSPIFGYLLGVPKVPTYDNGKVVQGTLAPTPVATTPTTTTGLDA